jgi:4-alpha-glucanotransferase
MMEVHMKDRRSGILLHITSLPSRFGIGDFGVEAYKFADFLEASQQTHWQVLPLNPTSLISGSSPYDSFSAFAGNPLFISPEKLVEKGLLQINDIDGYPDFPAESVDYASVHAWKRDLFRKAFVQFTSKRHMFEGEYQQFYEENKNWLQEFARFISFKSHFEDGAWGNWPDAIKHREEKAIKELDIQLEKEIEYHKFLQFIFFQQWAALKNYCNGKGIRIIGDIPYYVNYDSSEVWTNPHLFKLDHQLQPAYIAGVPPDYFSETGQLWGNPVYDWTKMKKDDFQWWISRIQQTLKLYDIVRIDHFRGFLAYWEVAAHEKTAINGKWIPVPGDEVFQKFKARFPNLPILAEDLGVITDDVRELMKKYNLPGMRILLFAFGEDLPTNSYAPHNHIPECVVYTGTHDNNTTRGWYLEETDEAQRKRIQDYLGKQTSQAEVHLDFIHLAMMSVANLVLFPVQDLLGLDSTSRMNRPATLNGNWKWRLRSGEITEELTRRLRNFTILFNRARGQVDS